MSIEIQRKRQIRGRIEEFSEVSQNIHETHRDSPAVPVSQGNQKYAHPEKLTAEMLNALIEKIVVHEKTVGEDGEKEQTVDIYYRFVGKID